MLEKKETAIFEIVSGDFFSYKVDIQKYLDKYL